MVTLHGRADLDGRLLEADPLFARLHQEAGGLPHGQIIIPQIAALVRLARDLGQPVQRPVLVADGGLTRDLIGDAQPDATGVDIVLRGWDNIAQPLPIEWHEEAQFDFARLEADGAWSADADLKITRMAAGVDRDLGFLPATARGSGLTQIFRLLPDAAGELPILAALAKGQPFRDQPAELIPATSHAVLLSAAQIYDEEGNFDGLIGSFTFVQPAVTAGDLPPVPSDLDRILSERLEPALRRPLAKIIAQAEVAALQQHGPLRQDYVRYSGDIAAAARHLLALLGDLANLQAIEAADFQVETEPVDLADLFRRATTLMRVRAAEKQVEILVAPEPSPTHAAGDFGRLLQILVNLLSNAVRYSPEKGVVGLRVSGAGDDVDILVSDQGPGIAREDQARIFKKFERLDTAESGGSGLGLYISRQLAHAMGGALTVESRPGAGAVFRLRLKAAALA